MAKARKKRQVYTSEQRAEILAAAVRDKLTAKQVKSKFGVTPVTYYSWRKASGTKGKRGSAQVTKSGRRGTSGVGDQLRVEIQRRVREMLPEIVRSEVSAYLAQTFSSGSSRKGGRRG